MDERDIGRRQFVTAVGVAAGVAATAGAMTMPASARDAEADRGEAAGVEPDVARFLGDLRPGARIDRWTIDTVHAIRMGAVPIVLRTAAGVRFQVDLSRRDDSEGALSGVARTDTLSLFLSNRGDGTTATDEEQGLGAMALAAAIARREAEGATPPALLTMRERREQHPVGNYCVLA